MADTDLVLIEHRGGVSIVTLNRPEALNALSSALSAAICDAFAALQARAETRVAILTGMGRAFCAGMDMKELASGTAKLQDVDEVEGAGHRRFGMNVFHGPIIAAVNGFAITGGLELALCCDVRIASTAAKFADTHSRVGVIPGGRMSALLSRLIGLGRAKEMCLGGNPIDALTAERWGLVNRVVEPDELLPACIRLAEDMAAVDPGYLRRYNRLIEENFEMDYRHAVDNEHRRSTDANQLFDRSRVNLTEVAERARRKDDQSSVDPAAAVSSGASSDKSTEKRRESR